MSMMANQAYQQNAVNTASPAKLTLMLYQGALRFINASHHALENNEMEVAHKYNVRAQDIIRELMVTLKMDVPVAEDFSRMYDYILYRLIQANIHKDISMLDEAREYVEQFIEIWIEVMKRTKQG
jgi:flagellar protein FliS